MNRNSLTVLGLLAGALLVTPAAAQQALTRDLSIEQRYVADFTVPEGDLKIVTWLDRQDDTYRAGDTVQIFVKTNRDAYITVIDVGTSGKVHVLFPNKHHPSNRVLAHQVVQIPGSEALYRIRVSGPAGHELIKVIATIRPDQVIRPDQLTEFGAFQSYRGSAQGLTKDLGIELKERHLAGPDPGAAVANKIFRILTEGAALAPSPAPVGTSGGPLPVSLPVSTEELFRLGEVSFYGDTGPPNFRDALRLYAMAAEAGHVGAMVRIGRIHEGGLDVDPDLALATRWYRKAADLGNTQAMVRLALLYGRSDGPRRDYAEAVRWLKRAANQGDGVAMGNLGKMHDEGFGVERAPREAARYILGALKAGAWTVIDQVAKLSDETRREVQVQLRQAGFYTGQIDGLIGTKTREAMVEFAKAG